MTPTTRLPLVAAPTPGIVEIIRFQATGQVQPEHDIMQEAAALIEKQGALVREMRHLLLDLDLGRSIYNSRHNPKPEIDGPLWAQIPRICLAAKTLGELE